jgi:hypothetical protein
MNGGRGRERALERLLSAELAEVLAIDAAAIEAAEDEPQRPRGWWLAVAVALLGVAVAGGVAWLQADDERRAAQAPFDPADPWWQDGGSFRVPRAIVRSPEDVATLPPAIAEVTVPTGEATPGTLEAVLRRDLLRQLVLVAGDGKAKVLQVPWRDLARHDALHTLWISATRFDATGLATLRDLPELRTLVLSQGSIRLDATTADVLLALTRLRHLDIAYADMEVESLARLAGLPELDTLVLGLSTKRVPSDLTEQLAAVARIRSLRALFCEGGFHPMPAAALRQLQSMERLVVLHLTNFAIDDEWIAALPRSLQHVTLPKLEGVTARGLATLAELGSLRSLALHVRVADEQAAALHTLLPKLPLECFEYLNDMPDEALWSVLVGLPKLRRVCVKIGESENLTALFERALACRKLEVLFVSVPKMPSPEQLTLLRDHPTLRRVMLCRYGPYTPLPTDAELQALRASVRAEIDVF